VSRFFNTKYPNHYLIVNSCSERDYDPSFFNNQVMRCPTDDHNVPLLAYVCPALAPTGRCPCTCGLARARLAHARVWESGETQGLARAGPDAVVGCRDLFAYCAQFHKFLSRDPQNVLAVHCKGSACARAGRSRRRPGPSSMLVWNGCLCRWQRPHWHHHLRVDALLGPLSDSAGAAAGGAPELAAAAACAYLTRGSTMRACALGELGLVCCASYRHSHQRRVPGRPGMSRAPPCLTRWPLPGLPGTLSLEFLCWRHFCDILVTFW
jgi:hypothetical protein